MDPSNKKLKSLIFFILKLFLSGGILYFLVSKIGIHTITGYIRQIHLFAFISAAGLYIFSIYLSSLRWSLLINQKISNQRLFSLYMIGSFFNVCLPGIIGGDAVKAYYLHRELKNTDISKKDIEVQDSKTGIVAIASVFMDRYIGFGALMIIGMMAFPFGFQYLHRTPEGASLIWLMPLLFFAYVFGSMVIFWFRAGERFRLILKLYEYFDLYKAKRTLISKAFLYSIFIQLLNIFSVYILSKGLSFEIPMLPLLIFLPVITTISMIPISISGLGLREFAFVIFFGTIGIPSDVSMSLSLSWFFSIVAANILGFVLYLFYRNPSDNFKKRL